MVLFLDACREEGSRSGLGIGKQHPGVVTFYSCSPKEKAYEIEALKHGSFTYALLSALRIQGEGNCATVERLDKHLRSEIPNLNRQYGKNPQNPYAMAEPATKLHLILLPQYATLQDIATLKIDAYRAEVEKNWELARQLWMRVNVAARGSDLDAIEAFSRIKWQPPASLIPEPVTPIAEVRTSTSAPSIFQFEVVTVNPQGREVKREKGQAQYIVNDLGKGISLEMVAVHELVHLHESHHNKEFWQYIERVLPDFVLRKQWLAENGSRFLL